LNAFKEIDEISIVYIPGANSEVVASAIQHCENLKDRFLIVDAEQSSDVNNLQPMEKHGHTRFAAFYYPWIKISDPVTGGVKFVPPGGYIAGIFARNDTAHGVHKAPANQVVIGAIDLEAQINHAEQDILNSRNVNVIRAFQGRGILVWGARTLSPESEWRYVSVRRLLTYIEQSIAKGTRWVVSEPNDEPLWIEVRESIAQFLKQCWMNGALMGRTAKEAFFVKCDRTTMTQEDIDNGKLICLIGVAPIKPAEFVLFRIGQWSDGTEIEDE
jgi:phage tail sheath protein FI